MPCRHCGSPPCLEFVLGINDEEYNIGGERPCRRRHPQAWAVGALWFSEIRWHGDFFNKLGVMLVERTILVTGSASGIGAATYALLRGQGHRVIGVDLRDAEIEVDLSNAAGRSKLAAEAARMAPGGLDGVIAAAGTHAPDAELVVSVNYFGAVATLENLHQLLIRSSRPRAVVISSTAVLSPIDQPIYDACLAHDEALARAHALRMSANAYASSKKALARWTRQSAVSEKWAGSGILLNAVMPGTVKTAMTAPVLATAEGRAALKVLTPIATANYGEPVEVAEMLDFLVNLKGNYVVGQLIFVDGGTDAIRRPEVF